MKYTLVDLKTKRSEKVLSLFEFIPKYIERLSKKKINRNGNVSPISQTTIWQYKHVERLLKQYKADRKVTLNYKDINNNFETDFVDYLKDTLKKWSNNTIGKHIKTIKAIMKQANIDGHHNNLRFRKFSSFK